MQLASLAILATALALVIPGVRSATCYSRGKCTACESSDSVWAMRQAFCGSSDWEGAPTLDWGWAHTTLSGRFATQQECWDGFENIIEQCYSSTAGGTYDYDYAGDAAHLDVSFCSCE